MSEDGTKGPKTCLWWCEDAALEGVTASYQLCCWVAQTDSALEGAKIHITPTVVT